MKKAILIFLILQVTTHCVSQENPKTTRLVSASWFPGGKSILFRLMSFDLAHKTPPVSATFTYRLSDGLVEKLPVSGSYHSISPDESKMIFTKPGQNNKHDIYVFDMVQKKEQLLVTDTFHKFAPLWSPDGRSIVYNRSYNGTGRHATIDICVADAVSGKSVMITHSQGHKSYNPVWAPSGSEIVYYFEKGDNRDQIMLTDSEGKWQRNLTNDTATHNYYPSWLDSETIVFTRAPDSIMMMKKDGSGLQRIGAISSYLFQFNPATGKGLYISRSEEPELMLYDWSTKKQATLLESKKIKALKVEG